MGLRGRNLWGRGGNTQGQRNASRRGGTGRRDWEGTRAGDTSRNEKVRQTEWKRSDAGGGWKKPRRRGGGGGGGGENKQKDPRKFARRRTGANKIPVNWEPPAQVPQGVTAKSAPPRKPSPSPMGPIGRGRPTPAWQKAEGAAPAAAGHGRVPRQNFGSMPSIPDRHNASFPSRPPPSNRPRRRSAGREMHRRGAARRAVSRSRRRRPMRPLRKEAESKRSDDRSRRYERDRPTGRRDGPGRKDGRKEQPRRRSRQQARRPPMQPPSMRDELIECSRHRKKRSWDKIDMDAENRFVCVAWCPCIVHLGGSKGWEELREALKSRGETDLLDDLDAEASATESKESSVAGAPPETSTAMVPVPEELAMPPSTTTQSLALQKVEPPPPPPNMVAKSSPAVLEGDIDPNDL